MSGALRRPVLAGCAALALALLCLLPPGPAPAMDPATLEQMSDDEIEAWAKAQLQPHAQEIVASARRNRIPPRLVATIILNELGDYGVADTAQEYVFNRGSVGIAQIDVDTAIEHGLVDLDEAEIQRKQQELALQTDLLTQDPVGIGMSAPTDPQAVRDYAIAYLTWEKLNDPKIAVEAAAREISRLFDDINANLGHTWPASMLSGPIDRADPYAAVRTDRPWQRDPDLARIDRERILARLVAAAYNSPKILRNDFDLASETAFANARKHGDNAMNLFAELLAKRRWYAPGNVRRSVVVLLDASGSMADQDRMTAAKNSARRVFDQMDGSVEVALIVFYDCGAVNVEAGFTTDPAVLRRALEPIQPSGGTPLAEGIALSRAYLRDNAASTDHDLVVLTDGEESCSGDLMQAVRR